MWVTQFDAEVTRELTSCYGCGKGRMADERWPWRFFAPSSGRAREADVPKRCRWRPWPGLEGQELAVLSELRRARVFRLRLRWGICRRGGQGRRVDADACRGSTRQS